MLALRAAERPMNTAKAMDPKQEEYRQYCDILYCHHLHPYTLQSDKMYRFIYYQAFREKKKSGGNRALLKQSIYFDNNDFDRVFNNCNPNDNTPNAFSFQAPKNPAGPTVFGQYKAMFRAEYKEQLAQRVIGAGEQWDLQHFATGIVYSTLLLEYYGVSLCTKLN